MLDTWQNKRDNTNYSNKEKAEGEKKLRRVVSNYVFNAPYEKILEIARLIQIIK